MRFRIHDSLYGTEIYNDQVDEQYAWGWGDGK